MKLRSKVALALLATLTLYGVAGYAIQHQIVMTGFKTLEQTEARKDLERCRDTIAREIEHLSTFVRDWAYWDDTYQFVLDNNDAYREANLSTDSMKSAVVGVICFVDRAGKVVFSKAFQPDTYEPFDLTGFTATDFAHSQLLLGDTSDPSVQHSGVMLTPMGPMLFANSPILDSQREGPSHGTLFVGRFLSRERTQSLSDQLRIDFTIHAVNDPELPSEEQDFLAKVRGGTLHENSILDASNENTIHARTSFNDYSGRPALILSAKFPRDIYQKGNESVKAATWSLAGSGILTLALLIALLQRLIVGPITSLTRQVVDIGASGEAYQRLTSDRPDEIGELTREFSHMLERLVEFRNQTVEVSRRAGMADIASGVIHNVGNALNSVNIAVATIADRTRNSKLPGVRKTAELISSQQNNIADFFSESGKGRQIPSYLLQLSEHLSNEQSAVLTELDCLDRSLKHISEVIHAQQSMARSPTIVQLTSARDLAESALTIVDASLRGHEIEVQRDFVEAVDIPVDRVKVTQLLVNLLTNAKEACQATGRKEKSIGFRVTRDGPGFVAFHVQDNGVGVASEDQTRIFSAGFTTKKDGRGIGLHFSATAAREMGGSLTVQSDGPGCGATFTLKLPTQRNLQHA